MSGDIQGRELIQHVSELPAYSPPAHSGTVNRRLVGREFGAGFEMVLGQVAPGGEASRHYHVEEAQIVFILKGEARQRGDDMYRSHPADLRDQVGRITASNRRDRKTAP